MPNVILMPPALCQLAQEATQENRSVSLEPQRVRAIAEAWHADREKIRYLESLLVKMARHAE